MVAAEHARLLASTNTWKSTALILHVLLVMDLGTFAIFSCLFHFSSPFHTFFTRRLFVLSFSNRWWYFYPRDRTRRLFPVDLLWVTDVQVLLVRIFQALLVCQGILLGMLIYNCVLYEHLLQVSIVHISGITNHAKEIGCGNRHAFNNSEVTKAKNNAFQRKLWGLGVIWKYVRNTRT